MVARIIIAEDSVGLLTPRERECLRLVDQHLSSKQIARELGMSKTSVDTYCDRARRKLGVEDRYAAVRLARRRFPAHNGAADDLTIPPGWLNDLLERPWRSGG